MSSAMFMRLPLSALLVLAPISVWAQNDPEPATEQVDDQETPQDSAGMLMPMPWSAKMQGVRKLSDSELTCTQIYAETQTLEKTGKEQEAVVDSAQREAAKSQEEMMKQANSMQGNFATNTASSLLSMIPGVGMVNGYAQQAVASARRDAMQENVNKMMQANSRLINTQQAMQYTQARREHLADLFLKKGCKLSEVKSASAK